MKTIKKKWLKTPLVIDLRAAQDQNYNGITKATLNWTKELIRISKKDQPIYVWTNTRKKIPKLEFSKTNVKYIHTRYSNTWLQILWFLNLGKNLDQILNLNQKYILFSPDIRAIKTSKDCIRHIQYFHDIAFIKHKETLSFLTRGWFFFTNHKKLYEKADLILTNSEFTRNELQNYYGTKNIKIVHPSVPKTLKTQKHSHPKNYYLIISTLQKRKNLNETIKKFKKENKNLLIVGDSERMYKKYKLDELSRNITFTGNISDEQKHFLIKNSIATIYPSKYEGFGIPILESIRLKKTCLTLDIKPYKQLFKNQTTTLNLLFKTKDYITPKQTNLYPLKIEVRKLKRLIYKLD